MVYFLEITKIGQFLSFSRDGGDEVPTFLAYQGAGQDIITVSTL
jgi:hypothetical protein